MPSDTRRESVTSHHREFGALLRCGASLAAICAFAAATPAIAQVEDEAEPISTTTDIDSAADEDAIIITGIRQSLANAQTIKRNSDTVVDAITAQDIGALPDRSVTEALQRVPGVAMNRFAGSADPDHFSVEGSGVVVRGLTFVRSEFNGRDTFSTGVGGQSINFADVPAELLGSVEVYKNTTAEMIEGGLAGTVNLNTRLPFQNRGFHVGFNVEANYGDMRKRWTPVGSLLVSNTWDTGMGRLGLLASVSYSQLKSRSDGMQVSNFQTRDNRLATLSNSTNLICRNALPGDADNSTLPPPNAPCETQETAGADGFADWADLRYAPIGSNMRSQTYNRERTGLAAAAQWESLDRRALLTLQYLRTASTNKWGEWSFEAGGDLSEYNTYPYGCRQNANSPNQVLPGEPQDAGTGGTTTRAECPVGEFDQYQYDENGVFESGYITQPGSGWRSADSGGSWRTPTGGMQHANSRRQQDDKNIVADYGANFKFNPTERWSFNVDAQYVRAIHRQLDMSVHSSLFADTELDLTGDIPQAIIHKPLNLSATWSGAQAPDGGPCPRAGTCSPNARINGQSDAEYFADPANTFWRSAMDHIEDSDGEQKSFKGDASYNFDDGSFLRRLKFGARYADRDQTVRYTTYNWGVVSEVWAGQGAIWLDGEADPLPPGGLAQAEFYEFPDFFRGQANAPPGGWYYGGNMIEGYQAVSDFAQGINAMWNAGGGGGGWVPLAQRAGVIPGTHFLPTDIQRVSQETKNAYVMLSFGSDEPMFGNVTLDGNIGVRYVDDRIDSEGSVGFPLITQVGSGNPFFDVLGPGGEVLQEGTCDPTPFDPDGPGPLPVQPPNLPAICDLGEAGYNAAQQFAISPGDPTSVPTTGVNKYNYFLPSLNLKFGLTEDLLLRFAASRVLARPSMADIRNFVTIGLNGADFTATAGNPFLKPALANQFDLTLEWYFARVGSLTVNGFYKEVENFFFQDIVTREFTNNGITQEVQVRGPANFDGKGKIKGFEVAYQQTYDFLPGFLSGLGMNASYTYIKSKGLPNTMLNNGAPVNVPPTGLSGNLPLEQLSKHNVNVAVFYEKGPISLRAAYNWRSKFLLTATDVIFPYFPIFNDEAGYLDASAFFSITPQVKVGIQAVNLTNEITKTLQQFTPDGLLAPRSLFMNDRRYSLIVRGNF